jgi:hypothetical protein
MSLVHHLADEVSKLKPGYRITFPRDLMGEIGTMPMTGMFGPHWTPAEQVMEAIAGSAYEVRYFTDFITRDVTFERLKKPLQDGRRTYVSPDRRDRMTLGGDGLYHQLP